MHRIQPIQIGCRVMNELDHVHVSRVKESTPRPSRVRKDPSTGVMLIYLSSLCTTHKTLTKNIIIFLLRPTYGR